MAAHSQQQTPPSDPVSPDPSNRSPISASSFIPSIISSVHHRPGYQRVTSAQEEDTSYKGSSYHEEDVGDGSVHGLRIEFPEHDNNRLSFGASIDKPKSSPEVPGSAEFLLSPNSARSMRKSYPMDDSPELDDRFSSYGRSTPSSSLYSPYTADTDDERLRKGRASTSTSCEPPRGPDEPVCKTHQHFYHGRSNWLSITILILSIYSTIFSGIWLGLAVAKPRYGRHVMSDGPLTPSTASLLCAAFAKTIELSFVTVFVTLLGQVLSHRAFVKNSKGITIAEMQMRVWIQQPGTMITHWETVKYAALTLLGMLALTTTFMAMLYTTASDALVSPSLKFGPAEQKLLFGEVKTIYGNRTYQIEHCKSPMTDATDPWYYGPTCMAIEHSGQAYHNYAQYLANWNEAVKANNGSGLVKERPIPVGMLYDNTTIEGTWIEEVDMAAVSDQYDRIVNNVTLAMPLSAVFGAARNPINKILQPQDLDGLGEYYVDASVPSPTINVLCAELSAEELSPMVLVDWPGFNGTRPNATNYPTGFDIPVRPSWLNNTQVDDLFGFGERYGRRHPVFPKLPEPFNTVDNITDLESDSIYVLATSNLTDSTTGAHPYMLCSLRSSFTPNCSTQYHASLSGGKMLTKCNDASNPNAYHHSSPSATSGVTSLNWTMVANDWALTMSLNAGIIDGQASNARLLTQLMPATRTLNATIPSIAEALAVMAGCTVIQSGLDAPLIHHWNYSSPTTFPFSDTDGTFPLYQAFNATVRFQDFSSGGTQPWQGMFYVILASIFLLNAFCLSYFIVHDGLVTDFIEPQNLFALAVNSPPSKALEGACGAGPGDGQLKSSWHIDLARSRDHFFIRSVDGGSAGREGTRKRSVGGKGGDGDKAGGGWDISPVEGSPVVEMFERLSERRSSALM